MPPRVLPLTTLTLGLALVLAGGFSSANAATKTICTLVSDTDTGKDLIREGHCEREVTSASTFKIALALMGYNSGFLKDENTPKLAFEKGDADERKSSRLEQTPTTWMRNSVAWYSQRITQYLGYQRLEHYVDDFDYGNRDVRGDIGEDNGLAKAWLPSSLRISPHEQVEFLTRLVKRQLPVNDHAYEMTAAITDYGVQPSGWHVHGKTGTGLPLDDAGIKGKSSPYGWFVGWAVRKNRTVTFARLLQDSERLKTTPGVRARDGLLKDLFATSGALD